LFANLAHQWEAEKEVHEFERWKKDTKGSKLEQWNKRHDLESQSFDSIDDQLDTAPD